ncbi:hypothetical protein SUS17_542 [Sphingomonas sp. S17]|nr:hypothetical protein SUS17_542 [Sphingomonas sp. S17]
MFGLRETGKGVMPVAPPDGGHPNSLCAVSQKMVARTPL